MRVAMRRALLGFGLAMALTAADAAEKVTWTAYTYAPVATLAPAQAMARIAEKIEAASGGELAMRWHLGGALPIQANNVSQAVADNVVQFGDDGFYQGNVPIGGVLRLPMLITSTAEFEKAQAIMRPYIVAAYAKKGMAVLGDYYFPLQVPFSSKKFTSLDDMKGQKMRVTSPEQAEFVKRFGGSPVTIGPAEVPSALDRGVVDGVFTASSGGGKIWKDLLKYNYRMGPNYFDSLFVVNKEAWDKLSPKAQGALKAMVEAECPVITRQLSGEEDEETAKMKAGGMVITAGNPQDRVVGAAKMASFWDAWAKSRGADTVEALQKVRAALGR